MKIRTIELCDMVIEDKRSGKISLIGIYDAIQIEKMPGGLSESALFLNIKGKPFAKHTIKIKAIREGNANILEETEASIEIGPNGGVNVTFEFTRLGFAAYGKYKFCVYEGKTLVGYTILKVEKPNNEN